MIGAPGVFFYIVFMPALQNTKGRIVGYKDHKEYGDSSIYENSPSDQSKFFLTLKNPEKAISSAESQIQIINCFF